MSDPLLKKLRSFIDGLEPLGETSRPASSGSASDEAMQAYRYYRLSLLEATAIIDNLVEDFTQFEFDDYREDQFKVTIIDIGHVLENAADVRDRWFNARVTLTEGGDS